MSNKVLSIFTMLALCSNYLFAQKKLADTVLQNESSIEIEALRQLNSTYRETNLCITPDGKFLLFMSARGGQPWSNPFYTNYKGKPEADGDIWVSRKENGKFNAPICAAGIASKYAEDEPNVSPDMDRIYFQSWYKWEERKGPYFMAKIEKGKMQPMEGFAGGISRFFMNRKKERQELSTDGATISADGKIFIFACGAYQGNMDLYISRLSEEHGWSYPKKLKGISTIKDERALFLAADGKTLYFASDAYNNGFGGLDIYKTTLSQEDETGKIINIGKPFNAKRDDYGFVITKDGNEAYMIREGDIYFADLKDKAQDLKPQAE